MFHKSHSASCFLFRNVCCSQTIPKCNSSSQAGKMMNKVMGLNQKSKKVWYKSSVGANLTFEELMKQTTKNNAGRQSTKRVNVLNKLLMQNITDLMATGENFDKLVGYGLEVSKVCISGDYRSVKVFWMAKMSEDDSKLDDILQNISGPLRHELSRLRIMGEVPKIQFVKDKTYANIAAVDRLLNKADFGEDFIPTCPNLLKNHPTIFTKIDPEIKEKIYELENKENLEDDGSDEELEIFPEMKVDVMGLNHSAIMARLNAAIQKSKAIHRQSNVVQNTLKNNLSESTEKPQYLSFTDFIKKQKIQEVKALGRRRSRSVEKEMYDQDITLDYNEEEDSNIDEYPLKI